MVREATDICLRVLKESNKSRFDSFSRYEQCIDHIPYYLSGLPRAHFFRQLFSKQLHVMALPFQSPPSRRRNWKSSLCFFVCTILQIRLRWLVRISPVYTSLSNKGDPVTWFLCTTPFKLKGSLILSFNYQFRLGRLWSCHHLANKRLNSFNPV